MVGGTGETQCYMYHYVKSTRLHAIGKVQQLCICKPLNYTLKCTAPLTIKHMQ